MRGEEIPGAGCCECHIERLLRLFHEIAGAFQYRKCGVAFIEMANFRTKSQRTEQTPASDAEDPFLLQTRFGAAAVKFGCKTAVIGEVRRIVGIEQEQACAPDVHLPR